MKFKRILFIIVVTVVALLLIACNEDESPNVKVLMPQGIPSVALGNLLDDEKTNFTIVDGPSVLSAELMKGDYDVIVAPIVLGAQLYTKGTLNYKLKAILTEGNTFLVCKETKKINSLKELEGKKIAAYGENTAPDIAFKAALAVNGVDITKVEIVYENSVSDVLSNRFLIDDSIDFILSAEPIISKIKTVLLNKVGNIEVYDLQEALNSTAEFIPQAGIYVKKDANEKSIDKFLDKVESNVKSLKDNTEDYVAKLFDYEGEYATVFSSLGEQVILTSIPNSSIVYKNAKQNKNTLDKYFEMINTYNNKILSGKTIDEYFYQD